LRNQGYTPATSSGAGDRQSVFRCGCTSARH